MLFQQFDCVTSEDDHFLVARATRMAQTRLPVVLKSALVSFLPYFFRWWLAVLYVRGAAMAIANT